MLHFFSLKAPKNINSTLKLSAQDFLSLDCLKSNNSKKVENTGGFLPCSTSFRYCKNQAIQGSAQALHSENQQPKDRRFSERLRRPSYPCRCGFAGKNKTHGGSY